MGVDTDQMCVTGPIGSDGGIDATALSLRWIVQDMDRAMGLGQISGDPTGAIGAAAIDDHDAAAMGKHSAMHLLCNTADMLCLVQAGDDDQWDGRHIR